MGPTFSNAVSDSARAPGGGPRDGRGAGHREADPVQTSWSCTWARRPDASGRATTTGRRRSAASRRSARSPSRVGVRVALEVIPNELSDAAALVALLERDLDVAPRRHLPRLRARAPDGRRRRRHRDRRRAPHRDARARQPRRATSTSCRSLARIDWDAALMTMQKIGYDGTYMMELANTGSPDRGARGGAQARRGQRFETRARTLHDGLHRRHRHARRPDRHASRAGCTTAARAARSTS